MTLKGVLGSRLDRHGAGLLPPTKPQPISQLTAEQVQAVFSSDLFCLLTDDQLAALHRRSEELLAHRQRICLKRRQRLIVAAACSALCIALAPVWHVVVALGVAALLWLVALAWIWDALQELRAAVVGAARHG